MSTDETYEQVLARQEFSGRLRCDEADAYTGVDAPTCLPICESCLMKWMEKNP